VQKSVKVQSYTPASRQYNCFGSATPKPNRYLSLPQRCRGLRFVTCLWPSFGHESIVTWLLAGWSSPMANETSHM